MVVYLRALEEAGHEVRVGSGLEFLSTVTDAGLTGVPCGLDWGLRRPVEEQRQAVGLDGEQQRAAFVGFFTGRAARHMCEGVLDIAAEWRPHVILWESTEFGAPVAAERLGIPHLPISIAMRQSPERLEPFAESIAKLRANHGLPPIPGGPATTGMGASACSRPSGCPPTSNRCRERCSSHRSLTGRRNPVRSPGWEGLPDGPLVYATLRSIFSVIRGPLEAVAAGGEGPWSVVIARGGMRDSATLEPLPDNVRVGSWVPQRALLQRADLIVHHAGYGTCMDAALAGVPQTVLPLTADQPEHAAAVRRLGLGATVSEVRELPIGPMVDRDRLTPASILNTARLTTSQPRLCRSHRPFPEAASRVARRRDVRAGRRTGGHLTRRFFARTRQCHVRKEGKGGPFSLHQPAFSRDGLVTSSRGGQGRGGTDTAPEVRKRGQGPISATGRYRAGRHPVGSYPGGRRLKSCPRY